MSLNATTTQEKAWMLRAAYELSKRRTPLDVDVDGRPQRTNGTVRIAPTPAELQRGITIMNRGQAAIWRTVSAEGAAASPLPPEAQGLSLKKSVWTLAGKPADLANLKQNDRVIVVLEGEVANDLYRQMAAIDLLPAGLEIEATLSGDEGKVYPFLGTLTETNIAQARDDRYAAAFDVGWLLRPWRFGIRNRYENRHTFKLAYIARAVAAGSFVMPAATVEDMYAPAVHARTAMSAVTVSAAR
jgi:uncharacterized protein YfaS (alpha-2-macroglobulin family)